MRPYIIKQLEAKVEEKQARIDELERALTFIACEDNAEGKLARAALKGSDT